MVIRIRKITNCIALPIFILTMPRLCEEHRNMAIGMLINGASINVVAQQFNVHRNTISRLQTRFHHSGTVCDRNRSGRPRVTTPVQDRYIHLLHLRNRFRNAELTSRNIPGMRRITGQTVRNRLREINLSAHRPAVRPVLRPHHRQARLQWARQRIVWPLQRWRSVMFTDESRFCLQGRDGRNLVYRRQGERYSDSCVLERDSFRGGSVMVWGGISYYGRTNLMVINGNLTAARYRDEVLIPRVQPFMHLHGPGLIFQQDNARPHVARIVLDHLEQSHIDMLPWPAISPDLSPIDHVWDELERRLRRRRNAPVTHQQLAQALQEEWFLIPRDFIRQLINSMRRRCHAVVVARGGHTRY